MTNTLNLLALFSLKIKKKEKMGYIPHRRCRQHYHHHQPTHAVLT